MQPDLNLMTRASNVTSQYGEDGIIAEIFSRIGTRTKSCVEFGAWDGKYLSNTWTLWHDREWSAVLIEGEKDRHAELAADLKSYPKVCAVCAFVSAEGPDSLDEILARQGTPLDLDLLSVDIDGDEYYVWKGLLKFRPRVVVVEHNPTIPPEIDLVQKPGEYFGASAGALVRLAHEKGYQLAACTDTNCIFVAKEDFPKLGFEEPDICSIFLRQGLSYLINSYDGAIFLTQSPVYSKPLPEVCVTSLFADLKEELFSTARRRDLPVADRSAIRAVAVALVSGNTERVTIGSRIVARLSAGWNKLAPVVLYRRLLAFQADQQRKREVVEKWREAGCPIPTPHEVKQSVLAEYSKAYRLKTLVETGTYLGDMVEAMRRRFRRIYSIELGEELWRKACERFAAIPKITILQGDSGQVLGRVMNELRGPALFWLDGHYSAGNTAKGELETPIFNELEVIFADQINKHVILVDDARCFNGANDYPTLDALREYVRMKAPGAKVEVREDIIRITP